MPYDASQFKPALYPDSSETSSSSPPLPPTRLTKASGTMFTRSSKASSTYRTERAKELKRLSTDDMINLVLLGEYKIEKTEARLRKYALLLKEQAEKERQAMEEAKHVREKMTQTILDTQQEALKARQDVEQYKLKLDNAQREIRRGIDVVKILEDDKEEMERALQRARDKARDLKEKSAVQLAREQGRRIGFEEGLEQGRLVVRLSQVQALAAGRIQDTSSPQEAKVATATLRRALTQGPNDSTSHRHRPSHTRRSSLDQHTTRSPVDTEILPRQSTRRSSVASAAQAQDHQTTGAAPSRRVAPTTSREQVPPESLQQVPSDRSGRSTRSRDDAATRRNTTAAAEIPQPSQPVHPEVFMQARSDESQSSGSGSGSVTSHRTSGSARRASVSASTTQHQNRNDRAAEQIDPAHPSRPLETAPIELRHHSRQGPSNTFPSTSSAPQPRRRVPAPPPVPPVQQFPGGIPRDDSSEASTESAASSVGELGIVTFPPVPRSPSAVATPQPPVPRPPSVPAAPQLAVPRPPSVPAVPQYSVPRPPSVPGAPQYPVPRPPSVPPASRSPQPPFAVPVHQPQLVVENGGSNRRTREQPPRDDALHVIHENAQARPPSRTGGPGLVHPSSTHHNRGPTQPPPSMAPPPHIPAPQWFVHPPPDLSAPPSPIGGTSTPVHRHQNPHNFLSPLSPVSPAFTSGTGSNRSSISIEFTLVPPSRPETPIFEPREHLSNEDPSHLSPNSRPISLPPVQSHPTTPPPTFPPPHHNAHLDSTPVVPVLPVLPRVVPQPTIYGTPSMRTVDLGSIRPGSTPPAPPVYEEAPAPFEYPAPLGFSIGSQGGASTSTTETAGPTTTGKGGKGKKKGKRKSVTLQQPSESVTPPVIPVIPSNTILPVAPPTISPVLPPVVIPVPPSPSGSTGGGGIYRHRDVEDEISETSFDSATKRNTHRNAQMYGQGNW